MIQFNIEQLPQDIDPKQLNSKLSNLVLSNTVISGGSQVNSIPETAEAQFNVRTIPEYDNNKVKQLFTSTLVEHNQDGAQLDMEIFVDLESVITNPNNALVQLTSDLAQKHFGDGILLTPSFGVTDASNLLRDKDESFPFIMFGPGEGTQAHTSDEYVKRDTYLIFIDFYKKLICTYASNN